MPIYLWNAKTRSGEKKSGELEASTADAVAIHLKNMGLAPGKVKAKPKDLSEIFPFLAPKVTIRDLVVFTRQFAVMVDAGLPLVQCLQILADQRRRPKEGAPSCQSQQDLLFHMARQPRDRSRLKTGLRNWRLS